MKRTDMNKCARVLKSLSEDTRLRIVKFLFSGEYSVSEIAKITGREYSQVSHHLGVLRNSGIVIDRRDGKNVVYRIDPNLYKGVNKENTLNFECCSIEFAGRGYKGSGTE